VAGALALRLLPAEEARLANVRAVDPEAYAAYLKGYQLWLRLTPADLDSAQRYCELALAKDPGYAPAQAGIALVWAGRSQMGITPPAGAVPRMKKAALEAVRLDDTLAEAHWALAGVMAWHLCDWAGAGQESERTTSSSWAARPRRCPRSRKPSSSIR
jgi:hypothetical protein